VIDIAGVAAVDRQIHTERPRDGHDPGVGGGRSGGALVGQVPANHG
jgi:hypothetical protein